MFTMELYAKIRSGECVDPAFPRTTQTRISQMKHKSVGFGVVHIFIPSEPTEHRLSQHSDERMPTVLAGPRIGEHIARHRHQPESVVEFAVGQQPGSSRLSAQINRASSITTTVANIHGLPG
jgi:hypothetical protein